MPPDRQATLAAVAGASLGVGVALLLVLTGVIHPAIWLVLIFLS